MKELKRAKGWYSKRKDKRFKEFVSQFRYDSLQILQKSHWYTLEDYQKICRDFTELTIKEELIDISGRGVHNIHIDHIIPVRLGWLNKLSPYLLGMSCNLQRLYWLDNFNKGNSYKLLRPLNI